MTDSDHPPSPTHCISCGSEVPDHAKFCQACGSAVYRPEDTSQPPKPAPVESPVQETSAKPSGEVVTALPPTPETFGTTHEKVEEFRRWWITPEGEKRDDSILLVLLGLVAAGLVFNPFGDEITVIGGLLLLAVLIPLLVWQVKASNSPEARYFKAVKAHKDGRF